MAPQNLQKKLEQAEQRIEELEDELKNFSYMVCHDLKAPLRNIVGFTQFILDDADTKLDNFVEKQLKNTVRSGLHCQNLIQAVWEYSRLLTDDMNLAELDFHMLLDHAMFELHDQIEQSGAEILYEGPEVQFQGDDRLVAEVLQHILNNAIKYQPLDKPQIPRIDITYEKQDNGHHFVFNDNGIGIEDKHFDLIFSPLRRLHSEKKYPGFGLGLSLARHVMGRHNGKIWCESTPGKGSCFHLLFSN